MKNILFTLALLISFGSFGQIQTEEFKMGYKRGYQQGYFKENGSDFNDVVPEKGIVWIEITDILMGDTYSDEEKYENYERGYYLGYYEVCSCVCSGQKMITGNYRTDSRRIKKINGNIRKYRDKINGLQRTLAKAKDQNKINQIIREIDYNQQMVKLIMSSCNWLL